MPIMFFGLFDLQVYVNFVHFLESCNIVVLNGDSDDTAIA